MNEGSAALRPMLARLATGAPLSESEADSVFESIVAGTASPAQIGAILAAMATRGETVDELTAAVRVMRRHAIAVRAPPDAIDCCGTGGDGRGTLNISTAVAFVVAACGVTVAKHGNRAASSRSGTADVLGALGVENEATPEGAQAMLDRYKLGFLFAPSHHPAMRAVGPIRSELGFRTIFNLAGPLANPANTRRQLVGVYHTSWIEPVAEALRRLGSVSAWVVQGSDGLDELTISGPSEVAIVAAGGVERRRIVPEDAGLARSPLSAIQGADPAFNAAALVRLLEGEIGAYRDIVLLNAAAALIVAGRTHDLAAGVALAAAAIDDGRARALLARMAEKS
ncbi:MAG TPA: anthranilate phosphoribosyltransferase [Alphaproteobacteria bacterium]|nr:anthranilate phosphoribosyltransferase [Alphaproteobacteria bacterium]